MGDILAFIVFTFLAGTLVGGACTYSPPPEIESKTVVTARIVKIEPRGLKRDVTIEYDGVFHHMTIVGDKAAKALEDANHISVYLNRYLEPISD